MFKTPPWGNSLVIQWLGHGAFTAKSRRSFLGLGAKTPQVSRLGKIIIII